jgi:hypothetical protein
MSLRGVSELSGCYPTSLKREARPIGQVWTLVTRVFAVPRVEPSAFTASMSIENDFVRVLGGARREILLRLEPTAFDPHRASLPQLVRIGPEKALDEVGELLEVPDDLPPRFRNLATTFCAHW